jgi:putative PIN family toxin of toxin-antitoxin system
MIRVVADTNIVASGLLWRGAPYQLLEAARAELVQLYTSSELLAELESILTRPKFRAKLAAAQHSAKELVELFTEMATVVRPVSVPRTAPDPDDDIVLATAKAASAAMIVTGDRVLRSIDSFEGIVLLDIHEALERIQATERP